MSQPLLAIIRESECIGCTKCIQACPFDAIIGSNKLMHSVIKDDCIGCELCIPACPVDCIDLIQAPFETHDPVQKQHFRDRVVAKKNRLQDERQPLEIPLGLNKNKKSYVEMAIERAKRRRSTHTL